MLQEKKDEYSQPSIIIAEIKQGGCRIRFMYKLLCGRWEVNDAVLFADIKVNGPNIYIRFSDVRTVI